MKEEKENAPFGIRSVKKNAGYGKNELDFSLVKV